MSYKKVLNQLPKTIEALKHLSHTDWLEINVKNKVDKILTHLEKYRSENQLCDIYESWLDRLRNIEKYSKVFTKEFIKKLGIEGNYENILESPWAVLHLDLDWGLVWADFHNKNANGEESLVSQEYDSWYLKYSALKKALFHLLISNIPDWPDKINMMVSYIKEVSWNPHFRWSYISSAWVVWVSWSSISEDIVWIILRDFFDQKGSLDEIANNLSLKKSDLLVWIWDEMFARLISSESKKEAKNHAKKIVKIIKKSAKEGGLLNLC